MDESMFRRMVADNLVFYRKRAGLTQAEVATRINYSDKSVSKWERAEGSPDVYVLNALAEMYGITLPQLLTERREEEAEAAAAEGDAAQDADAAAEEYMPPEKILERVSSSHSPFTVCIAVGCVWLMATIIFSICNMLSEPVPRAYLAFIFAIPVSFGVMEFFAKKWKLTAVLHLLFSSGFLWTLALSLHLTAISVVNIYLIYVIAAVAQLVGIFALGLYWQMIVMPKTGWHMHRRKKKQEDGAAQ